MVRFTWARFTWVALLALCSPACGGRSGLLAAGGDGPRDARGGAESGSPPGDLAAPDRAAVADWGPPWPDGPPPAPCAAGIAAVHQTMDATMVVCRLAGSLPWLDQCQAPTLCGPGWHLCSGAEYQKRFGEKGGPPGTETTWLGACVLTAGKPHEPTGSVCGACPSAVVQSPILAWGCTLDLALFVQRSHAGVVSYPYCMKIGLDKASTAGYWAPCAPDYKLRQGFCCRG